MGRPLDQGRHRCPSILSLMTAMRCAALILSRSHTAASKGPAGSSAEEASHAQMAVLVVVEKTFEREV